MATQDDPFASPGSDRTIIRPTPGGRTVAGGRGASVTQMLGGNEPPPSDMNLPRSGLNPLIEAANALLNVVPELRGTANHPNPSALRDQLARGIQAFEQRARADRSVAPEHIMGARYALCTLLDEVATGTPWGSSWAQRGLLVQFHNEAFGGEKFFQLLAKVAQDPRTHIQLLEFLYVCLALGLEGRYRVAENGRAQLEQVRERLAQIIRKERGDPEHDLSSRWRGAEIRRSRLLGAMPVWVALACCGVLMLGTYLALSYLLNQSSDPVFAQIHELRSRTRVATPTPAAPARPRLAGFLASEIQQGLVAVRDEESQSTVTILGDGLFSPGSSTIAANYDRLIVRIADALGKVPGQVVVTGHTDNVPIMSARFPSNWHLSQERARSVMQQLARHGTEANRLRFEGRGEAEPIATNDDPVGRARNRRVEVTLLAPAPSRQ